MDHKIYVRPTLVKNKWFRLSFSILLALVFALILLVLPLTARINPHLPFSAQLDLSLPFGAEIVHATGGLTITKTASPTPTVFQGGFITYTLVVRNDTPFDLTNVTVTDTVPANTECVTVFDPPSGWLFNGSTNCRDVDKAALWNLPPPGSGFGGVITSGTAVILSYVVRVNQPLPDLTPITNVAGSYGVQAASPSPFSDAGAETITTTVFAPTWDISKAVAPSTTAEPLDVLTYTLTISNIGHMATSGFYTITEQIPASTTYVTNSATPTATFNDPMLTWVISSPVVTVPFTVSFAVTVNDELPDKSELVNQDYNVAGGNVFSPAVGAPVTVTVQTPVTLTLTKTDTFDPVQAGDLITYTLTVTNDSSSKGPAGNVVITDAIPANTTLENTGFISSDGVISSTSSEVVWTFVNPELLNRGASASVFMVVRVTSPLTAGTVITNDSYTAGASNTIVNIVGLPVVTTTVESFPVLEISKVGLPEPVEAGGQLTYTIRYTNSGNSDAINVVIRDTFPVSTSYVTDVSTPTVSPGITTTNDITWNIPLLAGEGGGGLITLTLSVDEPQDLGTVLTNVVSITSSEVITPQLSTATNTISSTPNLHIRKTADPSPVAVGSVLTYTIVYSNDGNANAVGAAITDVLDSGVGFNDASAGHTFNNGIVSWAGLSIPADGQDQVLTLSVTVAPTLPNNSLLTNNVTVAAASVIATDSITTLVQAPSLAVTKIVSPTGVIRAGDPIEYTIIYTNTGAITITLPGVRITDTFPVSITNIVSGSTRATVVPSSPPEFVWADTADLPPDGSGLITITGQVITSPWASSGGQISNSVIVAGSGYSATDTVDSEGRPGLPFTITVTATPPVTQVNNNIRVNAFVQDVYGNPAFDGTPITLTTSLAGSRLDGSTSPIVLNTSNGGVTATLSSTVAGSTTLTAQSDGVSGAITRTTVATFTPGAVVSFTLQATTPQTAGVTFPITITAVDAFGNRVSTLNQIVTISDTTGTIAPTSALLVNGTRVASFTVFSATSPALDRITAISGSIIGTVDVEIRPNVPTSLTLTINPTSIRICQTAAVTTSLTDAFGNAISNKQVGLTLLGTGTANFSPPNPGNTNTAGIFTSTLTGQTPGPATVQATTTSPNLLDVVNVNIITPAIPTSLDLTVVPNPLATGGNIAAVTATVADCLGASVGQVVTFTVSNPGLASLPANPTIRTTNVSGVATTTLTSNSIPQDGTVVITATIGTLTQTVSVVLQTPALTITKTANPAAGVEVRPNNIINYTLQVRNTGTGTATNVVISDTLPAGVSFVSCTPPANCSGGATTTLTTPALGPNQVFTANIQVSVSAVPSGTILSNSANVRSSQTPLITSNLVAHPVTTATLNVFLPIIIKDFASQPDLISSFSLSPANPSAGQPVVVTVVITNVGTGSTGDGFWVDFYINPNPVPTTGNQRWDKLGSTVSPKQGIAWAILSPGLAPGASITLTSNGVGGLAPSGPHTIWSGSFVGGTQDLFVYADSFSLNASPNGGIVESNESNNRSELHFVAPLSGGELIDLSSLPDPASLPPRWDP